ncbi:TetR/AcrR family transcriptional regulator [Oceanispirochaeta sp.]|uniref:TetR/AcrR family transcriptional regulator n=1 Tax=Oceanispirochaeta sp. TaxID=2035350 RepID=UPI00262CE0F4|nr:TetR/AcrR family transcriptional regulator [Oceanispirochaeta sp.]MDA3957239.1 TetR/AcrR family transcriptional regulator [Oceanispirochaeta sp.]
MKNERKRDTSKKRQSILDAAVKAFVNEGYDKTSMDRIADIAGASKRTVYNHFPSKENLLQEVIDQFGREMHTLKLITYDHNLPLDEQLSRFADAEISVVNNPAWMGFIKMLLTEFVRSPDLAQEAMSRNEKIENSLTVWMRDAALDGKLLIEDPSMAASVFSAMMGGAFTWPALYRGGLDSQKIPELKKELIQTFLCRYRRDEEKSLFVDHPCPKS